MTDWRESRSGSGGWREAEGDLSGELWHLKIELALPDHYGEEQDRVGQEHEQDRDDRVDFGARPYVTPPTSVCS